MTLYNKVALQKKKKKKIIYQTDDIPKINFRNSNYYKLCNAKRSNYSSRGDDIREE